MKKHFISLFDRSHLKRTIILFTLSCLLIFVSSMVGISDNLPMIAMFLTGLVLLFFALVHPWRDSTKYAILALVCFGILSMEFVGISILDKMDKTEYISEGFVMGIAMLFCIPGILTGIIGALICARKAK